MYRQTLVVALLVSFSLGFFGRAHAQNRGFQLSRYEPTPAGEASFLINHPWFSATRYFAGGFTLDYAHAPLVLGNQNPDGTFSRQEPSIEHQVLGHFDLAGSFLDRVTLSLSLPVVFYEVGTPDLKLSLAPAQGGYVSDPRLDLMVRLWGQPDRNPFSLSLGGSLWIPLRKYTDSLPEQSSDKEVRGLLKLVLAGLPWRIRWSFTFGVLIRPDAVLGTPVFPEGVSVGTAIQLGALVQYADRCRRFAVGPEVLFSSVITSGHTFQSDYTSLELLLGAHYNVAGKVQLGLAGGLGLLREPGTPDGRLLVRIAYAPLRKPQAVRRPKPDPEPAPPMPLGNVKRTVPPPASLPVVAPATDSDHDGVLDPIDRCSSEPAGSSPDPSPLRLGCPFADKDGDSVPDAVDACPRQKGVPSLDLGKNGCPGLVEIAEGRIEIRQQIFFRSGTAEINLKKSQPILLAVADVFKSAPALKKVAIIGRSDDKGKGKPNRELSEARARSVLRWLVQNGVAESRLSAQGDGQVPLEAGTSKRKQRARNRRVEFLILDPLQPVAAPSAVPQKNSQQKRRPSKRSR